jgi:hypothetical protein
VADDADITDDELLALPADDIPAEGLAAFFTRRAGVAHERAMTELYAELSGTSGRHYLIFPDQDPKEKQRRADERRREEFARALGERQDRLLAQIEERQREVEKRRQEIDDNAIRLRDGRRAYVDGNVYRDGEGRVLTGADEADAARQHEYRPNASTWADRQENERQAEDLRRLKEKVVENGPEATGASATVGHLENADRNLTGYEKEFAQQAQARSTQTLSYGSADYMAQLGDGYQISSQPAFATAAAIASHETIGQPSDTESESATADMKKAPQPLGQGALKLG